MNLTDPRMARVFRFVRRHLVQGKVELVYAYDDGPELVETIAFPDAPTPGPDRAPALEAALDLLHFVAGISYFKAGVPGTIEIETRLPDRATADFLDELYLHGLGEFAWQNGIDLDGRIRFPASAAPVMPAAAVDLPRRTLVPVGGGKDSLVSVEVLKSAGEPSTAVWVGNSPLIEACARRTDLPMLNIARAISPLLFEYNRLGALNGHIPVTAINSAILVVAALLYGHDAIAFSNERSASSATLEAGGRAVNHQWSKGWRFEECFRERVHALVASDLAYYSLLRPLSELAVAARFARTTHYDAVFSSCNRNFRILGPKPADRWCGQCPKCHFVFLALAPFMPKPRLLSIFGRNLLDDEALAPGFDALVEYRGHKPFECVGEARESRAALAALAQRAEWREDVLVQRFAGEIAPQLDEPVPSLAGLLPLEYPDHVPPALRTVLADG